MSQKFEEFQLSLNLRQVSYNPFARDPVVRLTDPMPTVDIIDANLDYDSDEVMASSHDEEYFDVDLAADRSGVDPMEVELEDIRAKAVQNHYTKPSNWSAASMIGRLFCCTAVV